MSSKIRKCSCGNYTLEDKCPKCNSKTLSPVPPKYSPEDKYAKYRREWKNNKVIND